MKKAILVIALLMAMVSASHAKDVGGCKTIKHKPGRVYLIRAALYKGTHITLPARLMLEPVPGNNALWNVEGNGHHVMIQPNSAEKQGHETTLTLITTDNISYHFILRRVSANADTCVVIENSASFFQGAGNTQSGASIGKSSYLTPKEREAAFLRQRIGGLEKNQADEKKKTHRTVDEVLKKYRSLIYTRYDWSKAQGFKGTNLISDVYDDGRFTFIRVVPDHRGVMAVSAEIDGKEEMLEYQLDFGQVYRISGIYPKFTLEYGGSKVKVTRRDNKSNGVY